MTKSACLAGAMALILPVVLAGTSLATLSAANAQNAGSGQAGCPTGGSAAFVQETGNAGRFEVQSGRLALERSRHVAVRGYADQAVKDAGEMLNRVKVIDNAKVGAWTPRGLSASQTVQLNRLAGLHGSAFDREYMRSQIEISELLKQTFSDYGVHGESPTLRVYAAKAVTDYDAQILRARTIAGAL